MDSDSMDNGGLNAGRLLVGRQSPGLREALWRLVRGVKGGERKARCRLQPRKANAAAAMTSWALGAASVDPKTSSTASRKSG